MVAAANLLESMRRGFLREGRRLEDAGVLGLGLGLGTEVGAAGATAIGGALCKQIREADGCSNVTLHWTGWVRVV